MLFLEFNFIVLYTYRKIGFLIAFIYLSAASADIVIECEYTDSIGDNTNIDGTAYKCGANITSALSVPNGTPIKIIPIDEMQRQKVGEFELKDVDISNHFDNIMKAIATSFPNTNSLTLQNVSISHVSKDHLKLLPELVDLDLQDNKIKVLESDLFMYTPKLEFINFASNLISNVDDKLLSSLDLIDVNFKSNPCIEQSTCISYFNEEKLKDKHPDYYKIWTKLRDLGAVLDRVLTIFE